MSEINLAILILIVVGLIIHRYLTAFWEPDSLPYPRGFLLFANIFAVVYLIHFVWIFGWIFGVIALLLTFSQVIYGAFLWVFSLPHLISIHNKPTATQVNSIVYGFWSFIVIGLGVLIILNGFVSDYGSLGNTVTSVFEDNYIIEVFGLIGAIVAGNVIRIIVIKILSLD